MNGNVATLNVLDVSGVIVTLEVTDNTATGSADEIRLSAEGHAPDDCSGLFPGAIPRLVDSGDIVVTDAPPTPTSKDQCKHGGWRTYGIFKNQGDCVSFVATGGKNPPSGGR